MHVYLIAHAQHKALSLTLYYLDEIGFSLALPLTYTWSERGSANRLRVPTRWGS